MLTNPSAGLVKERSSLGNITVVVVEPDLAVAEVLAFMLESEGAIVQLAQELSAATRLLSRSQPDLLLCNLKLPDGDGNALLPYCQQVQHPTAQPIATIAIAHSSWRVDRQKAVAAGFHHYLFEPMEYSAVMATIAQVLQQQNWQHQSALSSAT